MNANLSRLQRYDGDALPFTEVFIPLVRDARRRLEMHVGSSLYELLTPAAHHGWENYLLRRLVTVGSKAADWQFQVHRSVEQAFPVATNDAEEPPSRYRTFIGSNPDGRLKQLLTEFPGLERLCRVLIANWMSTVAEFIVRLDVDRHALNERLGVGGSLLTPVVALEAGLSDPHRGGRCVVRAIFAGGGSLIYKPRSLAVEEHLSKLCQRLSSLGIPHCLKMANCWSRGTYGWMEDIVASACSSPIDIQAFYWRAGALLGLTYLGRGVDFHLQNLIAAGAHPVLVDAETLWHPQDPIDSGPLTPVMTSIVRTGFLPHVDPSSGVSYEWSALSRQVNLEESTGDPHYLPVLNGRVCPATDHIQDIQMGYCWVGEQLLSTEEQIHFEEWLRILRVCPRRLVRRSTAKYRVAQSRLTSPHTLRVAQPPIGWYLGCASGSDPDEEAEISALEQGDIPYFKQLEYSVSSPQEDCAWPPTKAQYLAQSSLIAESLGDLVRTRKAAKSPDPPPTYHTGSAVQMR